MIIIKNMQREMCFIPTTEQFKLVFRGDGVERKLTIRFLKSVYKCPSKGFTSTDIVLWKYSGEKLLDKIVNKICFSFNGYLKNNRHLKDHLQVDYIKLTEDLIIKLDKKYNDCKLIKDKLYYGNSDYFKIWSELVKDFEKDLITKLTQKICYVYNNCQEVDLYNVKPECIENLVNRCFDEYVENYILVDKDFKSLITAND